MLLLVRHGQTAANARGLLLGRADPPLSAFGRRQAQELAPRIPEGARIVVSPLLRGRETADTFGRPYEVDERWVELDYGELDLLPLDGIPPDVWTRWRADVTFAPPGGESLVELGTRVRAACAELRDEAADHDVVVVSHVSPIKAAIAWALAAGDDVAWRIFVELASIARIAVFPAGVSLLSLNETVPIADAVDE